MTNWLHDIELQCETISLVPLTRDNKTALLQAASDGNLWDLKVTSVPSKETVDAYLDFAFKQKSMGTALPFVVVENKSGLILGSSRFCNGDADQRRVEIGYTWYRKSVQRTSVNTECKLMLLGYAFDDLNAIAVEFRTHHENYASQNAIKRLGAKQDGILRQHMIMQDGSYRDTHVYSILNTEWPEVKKRLLGKLDKYYP